MSGLAISMDGEVGEFTNRWEPAICLAGLIRVRMLLANGQPGSALRDLRRLRNLAIKAGYIRLSIEILTLMALAEFDRGESTPMVKYAVAALSLSPSSGFLRIFLDEGEKVGLMLKKVQAHTDKELPASAQRLLQSILTTFNHSTGQQAERDVDDHGLVEGLSARELEVLELIVSGQSNGQIGEQLVIAESTVKWHVKNIFGKLGVKNRTSAALAAQQLRLI